MGNFQAKMALLVFSLVFAGCTTPFVEVIVNGEDVSDGSGGGGGGGCRPPAICGGGAKFAQGDTGQVTKIGKAFGILDDQSQQVEYYMLPDPRIHIVPQESALEPGSRVSIERKKGEVNIIITEKKK